MTHSVHGAWRRELRHACPQRMQEREYLRLIPLEELKRVRKLLKGIATSRGWPVPAAPTELDKAWSQLLSLAKSPAGGAWPDCFCDADLMPARLQKLSQAIDSAFLGGALGRQLRQLGLSKLGFTVDDARPGEGEDW